MAVSYLIILKLEYTSHHFCDLVFEVSELNVEGILPRPAHVCLHYFVHMDDMKSVSCRKKATCSNCCVH